MVQFRTTVIQLFNEFSKRFNTILRRQAYSLPTQSEGIVFLQDFQKQLPRFLTNLKLKDFEDAYQNVKHIQTYDVEVELKGKLDKYKDVHFPKEEKPFKDKKKVEVEPVQLNFDFNKPKAKVQEPKPVAPQKPLEQVIKEASDRRLKIEQDAYDREYGKGGIPGILRPE